MDIIIWPWSSNSCKSIHAIQNYANAIVFDLVITIWKIWSLNFYLKSVIPFPSLWVTLRIQNLQQPFVYQLVTFSNLYMNHRNHIWESVSNHHKISMNIMYFHEIILACKTALFIKYNVTFNICVITISTQCFDVSAMI